MKVIIKKPTQKFLFGDKEFPAYKKGDVVDLPSQAADILVKNDFASVVPLITGEAAKRLLVKIQKGQGLTIEERAGLKHYITLKEKAKEINKAKGSRLDILKDPKLIEIIQRELDKVVVGERDTRLALLIISAGRFVEAGLGESFNVIVNSESGAGKDFITSHVCKLWPNEDVEERRRISPTAFTYWHSQEKEPDWSWDGKIFRGEDLANEVINSEMFKLLSSAKKGELSQAEITVKNEAKTISVHGKPVMIITSASASLNEELLRRFVVCNLDETESQTQEIKRRQAKWLKTGKIPTISNEVKNALRHLKPVRVKIPFAQALTEFFPNNIIIRTNFLKFFDFLKSATALHQYQRDKDENGVLIPTGEDYEIARKVFQKLMNNRYTIPITRRQRKIIDILIKANDWLTVAEIMKIDPFISQPQFYRELDKLTSQGFVKKDLRARDGVIRKVSVFTANKDETLELPKWSEILEKMDKIEKIEKIDKIDKMGSNSQSSQFSPFSGISKENNKEREHI